MNYHSQEEPFSTGEARISTIGQLRLSLSTPILLYFSFQLLYGINVMWCFPLVGDAADYASLISNGLFSVRTTHIGFYILYYPVYCVSRLMHGPYDFTANLFTTALGAAGVAVLYVFLVEVFSGDYNRRRRLAIMAASVYGLSGLIWYHAGFAEVQAAMLFFLFAALAVFVKGHYWLSGILLGMSALVSQACAPAGLWFVALAIHRRIGLKNFIVFAGSFVVILAVGVAPVFNDFVYGPRGVFPSTHHYLPASITKTILSLGYRLGESFWPLLPLLLIAIPFLHREKILVWIGLISIPGFMLLGCRLCQVEYGFIWMPLYAIFAGIVAVGWEQSVKRLRQPIRLYLSAGLLVSFGVVSYYSYLLPKRVEASQANVCLHEIANIIGDDFLLTVPHVGFVYAHTRWPFLENVMRGNWSMMARVGTDQKLREESPSTIYVLDYTPPPHFMRRLLLDNALVRAYLSDERRLQFLNEFDLMSEKVISENASWTLEPVFECGATRLWLVSKPRRAELGSSSAVMSFLWERRGRDVQINKIQTRWKTGLHFIGNSTQRTISKGLLRSAGSINERECSRHS